MADSSLTKDSLSAVCVNGLSKRFHQAGSSIDALKNISLEAYTGEILMITGPSGCGKTTLLSTIAGTLHIDHGEVNVYNQPIHRLKQKEVTYFRRVNIGFIFQQYHLIPTLTCLENVTIPLLLNGIPNKQAKELAANALEKVGLKGREKNIPRTLSGGQQQRVAIARAIVHAPRLVICDEPTSALDAETGIQIMDLMKEMACMTNRCIIIVTHDNRIFKYANRVIEMNDGCITGCN